MKDQETINVLNDLISFNFNSSDLTQGTHNSEAKIYNALCNGIKAIERQMQREEDTLIKQKDEFHIENVSSEIIKFCRILNDNNKLDDYDIRRIVQTIANKEDRVSVNLHAYWADSFYINYYYG